MVILRFTYWCVGNTFGELTCSVDIYSAEWSGSGITTNDRTYLGILQGHELCSGGEDR